MQLVDRRLAGPGDRLVGGDHQALDPGLVVERLERRRPSASSSSWGWRRSPCGASARVGVDLGDDQRHVVVHAPVAGVVDDDRAGLDQARRPLGADACRRPRRGRCRGPGSTRRSAAGTRAPSRSTRSACRPSARRRRGRPRRPGSRARRAAEDRRADHTGRADDPDSVAVAVHRAGLRTARWSRKPPSAVGPRGGRRRRRARRPRAGHGPRRGRDRRG